MRAETKSFALLVVGLALVVNPFVPGIHLGDGAVYQYEAAEVEYGNETGLDVTSVRTGEEVRTVSVDDEIVCDRLGVRRLCQFEYYVLDGNDVTRAVPLSPVAHHEYVYADETLYRPTAVERDGESYAALEPVDDPDPLRYVAARGDVPSVERRLADSGRTRTYRELPHDGQLVEIDGAYYTFYTTGVKRYGDGGSFCSSGGEGFCGAADAKRFSDTALTVGSRVGGVLLVLRAWRSRGPD